MNKVTLVGRVTKDIPLQKTPDGTSVANFTLAIRRDEKNTDYVFCSAYGKRAENLSLYVKKGNRIGVCGRLRTWSVEKNKEYEYRYSVTCDEIEFLENKNASKPQKTVEPANDPLDDIPDVPIDNSDLPF